VSKVARKSPGKGGKTEPLKKRPASAPAAEKVVAAFTAAVKTFQKSDFPKSAELFKEILKLYPEEREICDRARDYLAASERQINEQTPRLRDAEDHYNWGVILLNRGDTEEAARTFEKALELEPANEKARYALACAHARAGRANEALDALRQAIRENRGNRVLARNDADLESLRSHPVFHDLLKGPGGPED